MNNPKSNIKSVVLILLYLTLVTSVGGVIGIIILAAFQGITGTITITPGIIASAIIGAALSTAGFAIFALALSMFGPILSAVYEEWTAFFAPVIGGTVGAAIGGGLPVSVIYIIGISTLVGGIASVIYHLILSRGKQTLKDISDNMLAGLGFGTVNGILLAVIFKILDLTGISWPSAV